MVMLETAIFAANAYVGYSILGALGPVYYYTRNIRSERRNLHSIH